MFQTENSNRRIFVNESWICSQAIFGTEVSRPVIRSQKQAEGVSIHLARKLYGVIRIDNCPRMHRSNLRVEDVDALEEERPLFGEENWEPLVCGDDQLIGLDLSKVRIDGEVERDIRSDAELPRQPWIEFHWFVNEAPRIFHSGSYLIGGQRGLPFSRL